MSLSKNVMFARDFIRHVILNALKNKTKIKKTTKIKFLYYVVRAIEVSKTTILILVTLRSVILFV
jgi:hypothetical protein